VARSKAIQAAVKHRNEVGLLWLDVPEWVVDGKPLRVHWRLITLAEYQNLAGQTNADIVIMKALDASGEPLFTVEDKPELRAHVDANVLARIADAVVSSRPKSQEQAEKNS
jgi:hypothetical protein